MEIADALPITGAVFRPLRNGPRWGLNPRGELSATTHPSTCLLAQSVIVLANGCAMRSAEFPSLLQTINGDRTSLTKTQSRTDSDRPQLLPRG